MVPVGAIVLAAGRARRFGAGDAETKAVAGFKGMPLIGHVVVAALASRVARVVVVTGHAGNLVERALSGLPVLFVRNGDHASGMASSLKAGIAALPRDVDGALVLLADMPLVSSDTLNRLIERFGTDPNGIDAVVPTFEERQGNPVLIGRRMFPEMRISRGDEGARKLLAAAGRTIVLCPVADRGIEIDVDTRAALMDLQADH